MEVTIDVSKANPTYTVPTGLTATYGDTLANVTLPNDEHGTYTWQEDTKTSVGNAGEQVFKVTYTPEDTNNYNIVKDIEVSITVQKANPTYTLPSGLVVEYGKKLSDIILPEGFSWENPNELVGNVGSKKFRGKYTPKDTNNYNDVEVEISVEVVKATPKYEIPTGLTATYGDTLSDVVLPTVSGGRFEFEESGETSVGNAGTRTFYVKYIPDNQNNYNIVEHIPVTITVNKAKAELIQVPTVNDMTYNPNTHLSDIDLPDGWAWEDPTIVPTVGNSGYTAIYTPKDVNNYDYSGQNLKPVIKINVAKAMPEYNIPVLTGYRDETLADVELPILSNGKFT